MGIWIIKPMQNIIKNQINEFLSAATSEVIAIKGPWGVGKTFAWNKWLKDAMDENKVSNKRYAYVSLFGLKTIDEVKQAIFQQTQKIESIGVPASFETLKEDPFGITEKKLRKYFSRHASNVLSVLTAGRWSFNPLSFSYFLVKDQIICLDDMERREASLTDSQLMGLVNQLKLEKNCRVVLIFNDDESNLEAYKIYREKVVDKEFEFQTTPREAFDIVFNNADISDEISTVIREGILNLEIINIRILLKIKSLAIELLNKLQHCSQDIHHEAIRHLVLFTWCFYAKGVDVPSLEYVFNVFPKRHFDDELQHPKEHEIHTAKEKGKEEDIRRRVEQIESYNHLNQILERNGYIEPTNFNQLIAQGIAAGYFDSPEWDAAIEERVQYYSYSSFNQDYKKVLNLYRYGFDDNSDELIEKFYAVIADNLEAVDINRLHTAVTILRELGKSSKADELIDKYITYYSKPEDIERFDMNEINYFGRITDEILHNKFIAHYKTLIGEGDPLEIFAKLSESHYPDNKERVILNSLSIDDFIKYFKQLKDYEGAVAIRRCLELDKNFGVDESNTSIGERATQALKIIAHESELNKKRIAGLYKVVLDD